MTSEENPKSKTILLSFKFLNESQAGEDLTFARDLLQDPKHEVPDSAPFSFAFSGTHDGGVMPLPRPESSDTARLKAHNYYGHLVDVLKEGKSAVDSKITSLARVSTDSNLPVSKKAKVDKEDDEDEEDGEEEEEMAEVESTK